MAHPSRRWTAAEVTAFRKRYRAGESAPSIAAEIGCSEPLLRKALAGVTYRDVPEWCRSMKPGARGRLLRQAHAIAEEARSA